MLIAAHPTWGVDVGAAQAIHQALRDMAAGGVGVLIISEDLDEILSLCDRIAVLHGGVLSPPQAVGTVTIDEIGLLMGGMAHAA